MPVATVQTVQQERKSILYQRARSPEIPPLENGDHLTREEFERRYDAMPHLKKAELIGGIVYMPSPVKRSHGDAHADVMFWVGMYRAATPGVRVSDNATTRMDEKNAPQPDISLRIESPTKGTCRISEDDYLEGVPELIVEIAGSSASYDLHHKLEAYRLNGVPEYLVWQIYENQFNWFILEDEKYIRIEPNVEGILRSRVFPGLYLAVDSLLSGDMATVAEVLQKGVQSEEHTAFQEKLASL